jgi:hypothetical protein
MRPPVPPFLRQGDEDPLPDLVLTDAREVTTTAGEMAMILAFDMMPAQRRRRLHPLEGGLAVLLSAFAVATVLGWLAALLTSWADPARQGPRGPPQ